MAGLWFALGLLGSQAASDRWESVQGGRRLELTLPQQGQPGFTLLAPHATGILFSNRLDEAAGAANRVLENGSGVAAGDYDRDGLPDLFFCSLEGQNILYRNLGNWRFEDVTIPSGLPRTNVIGRGATFAELNGDGWPDLLVSTLAEGVRCFLNDGLGGFRDATSAAGTTSKLGATTLALADVDGNGTLDLYVATYRPDDARDNSLIEVQVVHGRMGLHPKYAGRLFLTPQGLFEYGDPDVLYLNDGAARFREVAWTAGTFLDEGGKALGGAPLDWGLTASFRDLNDDGWPDLYVCNDYWTPDRLWINDGRGRFHSAPILALRHTSENSMGVDFADLDGDGHLDFLVLDMLSRDPQMRRRQVLAQTKILRDPGEIAVRPQVMRNVLFHNRGDGTFAEIADYAGLEASDWSWQPVFLDVDLDGDDDLLIPAGHRRDVQDLDATGKIRALQHPWPKDMERHQRQAQFTKELLEHGRLYPPLELPVVAFRNLGDLRFEEVTHAWGTTALGVHQGIALGDFDLDGDLDFALNNLNGTAALYRNDAVAPRIAVRLNGAKPNTEGIGAKVSLSGGPLPRQEREVVCGGRYLSGFQPLVVFATGTSDDELSLEVRWRSGRTSRVTRVRPNSLYELDEPLATQSPDPSPASGREAAGAGRGRGGPGKSGGPTLFADVSERLGHRHHEEPFDDFARQRLLPRKLSQLGPGVAWMDVTGDGWEDLVIASGKDGRAAVLRNDGKGGFNPISLSVSREPAERDQTGVVGFHRSSGAPVLVVGVAHYESDTGRGPAARQYDLATDPWKDLVPAHVSSSGPLALADMDGDGDLDLFIGGRCLPGRYPLPAPSLLLRNTGGEWVPDEQVNRSLARLGMVSGAVWSDLDGDGWPELVVACDWGPIGVLHNRHGALEEVDFPLRWRPSPVAPLTRDDGWAGSRAVSGEDKLKSLRALTGWWNGVGTGDLDGDGRLDIVASNWGLNTAYSASVERPATLYYADYLGRGSLDLVEAEFDAHRGVVAPRHRLDYVADGLPALRAHFASFRAFSEATTEDVFQAIGPPAGRVEAVTLASVVFLNRGDHFEARELPRAAQWAPAFGVVVSDFDGDGWEDVFLSQNFFALPWESPRLDAGRGLLLLGGEDGDLRPVPGQESGIRVYGEQRGAAACDYDHDGRTDLVVTQNAGETRLFRNTSATPGVRVRLRGPNDNPMGVGAVLRGEVGGRRGPAREVRAGSGYWSQDGATQVLSSAYKTVHVRWPGGAQTSHQLPVVASEVVLGIQGETETVRTQFSPR